MEPSHDRRIREPIAIVGMGCRFPGEIHDPESFWRFLLDGGDAVKEVPADRWNATRLHGKVPGATGRIVSRRGSFLSEPAGFDAGFFGISPREAARMDPQQRWLLELAWETLEDAGIPPVRLRGSATGVFLGISSSDYGTIQQTFPEQVDGYSNSGNALSIASNRLAFWYDWKGPALSIDTACSSSLVAVDRACRSLWSGECALAMAGGVSAIFLPDGSIGFSKAGMLSPDGLCRAFDARANGYVRGEGAGLVLLKPLSRALADGDRIHATILASVVNQDGRTSSMAVPSITSQSAMLEDLLRQADVAPTRIVYVEAHGTGTPVGDPIEARALGEVLANGRKPESPCLLGSVKTNLGHLEPASGIAGLIKAALVAREGQVPESLHFRFPNPQIDFEALRLRVVTKAEPLPRPGVGGPLVVVNSFGFGGTNAQCLLSPPPCITQPSAESSVPAARPLLLPISAASEDAVRDLVSRYEALLGEGDTRSICLAAAIFREPLKHRVVLMGTNSADLIAENAPSGLAVPRAEAGVVMVFTGQGAQYFGMARGLLAEEPVFARCFDEVAAAFDTFSGFQLRDELLAPSETSRLDETEIAQPTLFAIQCGLIALWESWGIRPAAVTGHSLGEVAAAFAAGIFDLPEAVRVVYHRSRLQGRERGGGMAAVGKTAEAAEASLAPWAGRLAVAAWNSPSMVTVAGEADALEAYLREEEANGVFVRKLPGDYAFHTSAMNAIEGELREALTDLHPRPAKIPFFSTVTGGSIPGETLDAAYWWRNVREPVRFAPAVTSLVEAGYGLFLEVGPHPALAGGIRETLANESVSGAVIGSLHRDHPDAISLARAIASLWIAGATPDWEAYLGRSHGRRPCLPRYPWQHQTYWIESPQSRRERLSDADHPLLGVRRIEPSPAWEILLDPRSHPYLNDHRFWNRLVFPAAAFTEMMLAAGRAAFPGERVSLERVTFERFLFLSSDAPPTMRLALDEESREVRIHSRTPESTEWQIHARGRIVVHPGSPAESVTREIRALRRSLTSHLAHWDFYEAFTADGYDYGPAFQGIEQVWYARDEALAEIVMPEAIEEDAVFHHFHPVLLDACFQTVRAAMERDQPGMTKEQLWLPASLAGWFPHEPPTHRFLVHARIVEQLEDHLIADLECLSPEGRVIAEIRGFGVSRMAQGNTSSRDEPLYERRWISCEHDVARSGPDRFPQTVLLLADHGGLAERLSAHLTAEGIDVLRFEHAAALKEALAACPRGRGAPGDLAILHISPLDHPSGSETDLTSLHEAERSGVYALLDLARELHTQGLRARILSVTRSETGATCPGLNRPASAALEGFLRVAAAEMPESQWSSLILEAEEASDEVACILAELPAPSFESEIAWHEGRRYAARLSQIAMEDLPRRTHPARRKDGTTRAYALEIGRAGTLDRLELNEVSRQSLRPGEIEVRVAAAGVNFRDLLKILNRYPGTAEECRELGDDFAGEVIEVGPGVTRVRVGDLVTGVARSAFRTHLVVEAARVLPVPPGMSAEEAATLPTTFLTAHHALCDLAQLQAGESVLIHAAAGGVGLAAIQVAQHLGLEIFATAGSEEKRDYLRRLGVSRVMDSRSLDFVQQVRDLTGGRGVDAVLNSLSGEFLRQSLGLLAPFGRFLEIGKIDLHADRPLGMGALRDCLSFFVIDMDRLLKTRPAEADRLFQEVSKGFAEGYYRPLPFQAVPAGEAKTVFQEMARGRHLGKRILDFRGEDLSIGVPRDPEIRFREDRTYLVSGGHSGFGFATAKWLAANGAKHLALLSRRGPRDETVHEQMAAMVADGIHLHDLRADLTDPASLARALASLRASAPPLGGVIHAAMVLEDRFLSEHDHASFALALDPKARGAWLLHEATRDDPLEYFIVYSSIAAIAGSPRQANYAAGNTFLEGLVRYRRHLGLPGLAIQWGALSGSGFVERNEKTLVFLEKTGSEVLPGEEALAFLGQLLDRDVAALAVARVNWATMGRYSPTIGRLALYCELPGVGDRDRSPRLSLAHLHASSPDRQLALVEDFLAAQIAAVFGTEVDTLDRETPVTRMGLDSLMAIELLNRIEAALGVPFPMGAILSGPSVRDLTPPVLRQILEAMPMGESESAPP